MSIDALQVLCRRERRSRTSFLLAAFSVSAMIVSNAWAQATFEPVPRVQFRRPIALARLDDLLLVANRRSGTLSLVSTADRRVQAEIKVGRQLSDLVSLPNGRFLLTDELANQLIVGHVDDGQVVTDYRLDVPTSPVTVRFSAESQVCSVASLWARQLTLLAHDGQSPSRLEVSKTIDLPFAPRMQVFLDDGSTLVVANAFGGQLALVDTVSLQLTSVRSIDGHNIRGLAVSYDGQHLLISHQMLMSSMPTTRQRVFWGQVVSNLLRSVSIDHLLERVDPDVTSHEPVEIAHWSLHPLGQSGNAAGDPGQIVIAPSRRRVICFSGVNQIGVSASTANVFRRIDVGQRPTALALDDEQSWIYVANTHDDSVSVVDLALGEVVDTISLGRMPIPSLVDRGEVLFYDARLSLDGWFSCHSCHTDGHSNGLLNDNFGDDVEGTPKRVLSLLGVETTHPWGWNGTKHWLSNQVQKSIETTMRGPAPDDGYGPDVGALTEFLRTLPAPPALLAARRTSRADAAAAAVERGRALFRRLECTSCHKPPTYTSHAAYDVGLEDEAGQSEFNPPSLLGVSQQAGWFHDSRARTLPEVFTKVGHPHGQTRDLEDDEVQDLVTFLSSL